jgi:hypothetical protein
LGSGSKALVIYIGYWSVRRQRKASLFVRESDDENISQVKGIEDLRETLAGQGSAEYNNPFNLFDNSSHAVLHSYGCAFTVLCGSENIFIIVEEGISEIFTEGINTYYGHDFSNIR